MKFLLKISSENQSKILISCFLFVYFVVNFIFPTQDVSCFRRSAWAGTGEVRVWCDLVCGFNDGFLIHSRYINHLISCITAAWQYYSAVSHLFVAFEQRLLHQISWFFAINEPRFPNPIFLVRRSVGVCRDVYGSVDGFLSSTRAVIGECPEDYGACHVRSSLRHPATEEWLLAIPDIQSHGQGI